MKFFPGWHGGIGLDISGRWMKAAQERGGSTMCLRLERTAPDGMLQAGDAARLSGALDRRGFRGRRVTVVAPRSALLSATLELPPRSSGAPIEQLARIELARAHKCDPQSFELGTWDLPAPARLEGQTHVFAAALPHAVSEQLIGVLAGAGLEVNAVDIPANALARGLAGHGAPEVALELGWEGATLAVLHGGVVAHERTIDEGGLRGLFTAAQDRTGLTTEVLDVVMLRAGVIEHAAEQENAADMAALCERVRPVIQDYVDTLVREVRRSFGYVLHRYPACGLRTMTVTGEGAALPDIAVQLGKELAVACAGVSTGSASAGIDHPGMVMALGAARFGREAVSTVERRAA